MSPIKLNQPFFLMLTCYVIIYDNFLQTGQYDRTFIVNINDVKCFCNIAHIQTSIQSSTMLLVDFVFLFLLLLLWGDNKYFFSGDLNASVNKFDAFRIIH